MPTRASSSTARLAASLRLPSGWWMRMPSTIWWPIVWTGFREVRGSWKIMAIPDPRILRSSWGGRPSSSRPLNLTDPVTSALAGRRPRVASMVTVLPEPDSPTIPRTFAGSRLRSTPRTADTRPSMVGNVTWRSEISSTAAMSRDSRRRAVIPPTCQNRVRGRVSWCAGHRPLSGTSARGNRKMRRKALALVMLFGLLAAACGGGSDSDGAGGGAQTSGQPDLNAEIRVAANEDQWTEGGTGAKSYHFMYVYNVQVYEPLIYLGSDYTLKPGLAERWELQPDGKTWRFFLRQNVRFH